LTSSQKLVPLFVIIVLAAAVGYAMLPFRFADEIDCGPPLFGAKAKTLTASPKGFIKPVEDCLNTGKSRLTVSAVTAFVAALAGTAAIAFKPQSAECMSGSHDSCREWWPGVMGGMGSSLGCQCDCHRGW